jgi:hypothetical protein
VSDATWLEWRRAGITATDVANAWAGTYGGLYAVVASKLDRLPPVEQTPAMARGLRWEPRLADAVHVLTGYHVVGEQHLAESTVDSRHRATLDGYLATEPEATLDEVVAVVEFKTRGVGVPRNHDRYLSQVVWQMYVADCHRALLVEAVVDDTSDTVERLALEWIDHDPALEDELLDVAATIAAHVEAGTLPEPDNASALDVVRKVHAVADPDRAPANLDEYAADLDRLAELKAAEKAATEERRAIEARVLDAVGSATRGDGGAWTVTVSKPALRLDPVAAAALLDRRPDLGRLELDLDAVKAHAADELDTLRTPTGARTLRLRERRDP